MYNHSYNNPWARRVVGGGGAGRGGWWISSHIIPWPRSLVVLPFAVNIEACCMLHEVYGMHLGCSCHYQNKLFLVFLDLLWNALKQQGMLLCLDLWQPQCGLPLSQNKNSNITLCYCLAVCSSQSQWEWSSIILTICEKWSRGLVSRCL